MYFWFTEGLSLGREVAAVAERVFQTHSEQSAFCFGKYRVGRCELRKVQYIFGK